MQIYCSRFITMVRKESQIFYNILYRCLKPANPFSLGSNIIGESAFSSRICNKARNVFSNSFTRRGFSETSQATNFNEFSTINGWTILFGLARISFPSRNLTGSLTQRLKSSGYHDWVSETGVVRIKRGKHLCFIFRHS